MIVHIRPPDNSPKLYKPKNIHHSWEIPKNILQNQLMFHKNLANKLKNSILTSYNLKIT